MLRIYALCLFVALGQLEDAFGQGAPATPAAPSGASAAAGAASAASEIAAKGKVGLLTACTAPTAQAAVSEIVKIAPPLNQIRTVSREQFLPNLGSVDVLVFNRMPGKDEKVPESDKISYRVVLIDSETANMIAAPKKPTNEAEKSPAPPKPPEPQFSQVIPSAQVWAEPATGGANGTDFKKTESSDEKTLLRFKTNLQDTLPTWQETRVYVIGCTGADAGTPKFIGSYETNISSTSLCRFLAVLMCLISYCLAAIATFFIHKSQRTIKTEPASDGAGKENHPITGTNYAGLLRHFDPVVLSAGGDGCGSATKLQILFFSLLVFGLVSYIWMLTGHLTGLSTTVLLLMGISGLGATASAGADLTKNRLDFDNWAWLINRGWLPKGGVAEVNRAQWKDIVTTDGTFDVYRFQMITFSVLVGIALLGAGTQLTDLSSFEIPQALLGILGLSQAVYVVGKLVAPPSITDLNAQIGKLQTAEKNFRDKLDMSNPGFLAETAVLLSEDDKVKAAKVAYSDYVQAWETTRTMFESTLGRLVPKGAESLRPPFMVPQLVRTTIGTLKPGKVNESYKFSLSASGGTAPYKWTLVDGVLPVGLLLSPEGKLTGTPQQAGELKFTLQVEDSKGASKSNEFTVSIA